MTRSMNDLLREALEARAAATPPTPCLDAETAAALADDTLSSRERSSAEAHVADCAQCQALLSTLVRMTPPRVVRAWWRRPAIRWIAPLAVAATAVIVWVSVPRRPNVEPAVQSTRQGARAAAATPEPQPQSKSGRDLAAAGSAARARVAGEKRDPTPPATNAPAAAQPKALADSSVSAPPSVAAVAQGAAEERRADAQLPSTPLPEAATQPSSAPSVQSTSSPTAPAEPAPLPSLAETVTVTSSARAERAPTFRVAVDTLIVSSNPISRWRIERGGMVQHSADGGSTWQVQSTGVNVTLTAGSSPSPSVCWLVGPAGIVLLTTDEGRSWQRLAFPEAIDLISVRASDDKSATVVTSDGRRFRTSDRGASWRR